MTPGLSFHERRLCRVDVSICRPAVYTVAYRSRSFSGSENLEQIMPWRMVFNSSSFRETQLSLRFYPFILFFLGIYTLPAHVGIYVYHVSL